MPIHPIESSRSEVSYLCITYYISVYKFIPPSCRPLRLTQLFNKAEMKRPSLRSGLQWRHANLFFVVVFLFVVLAFRQDRIDWKATKRPTATTSVKTEQDIYGCEQQVKDENRCGIRVDMTWSWDDI